MLREPILTERLMLRSTVEADCPACLELWLRPEEGRYLVDPTRESATEAYLSWGRNIEQDEGWYPMIVCLRETGEMIGTCSIVPEDNGSRWDLGYVLDRRFWRMGFGTEMLRGLIETGRMEGIHVFSADVADENAASCALAGKIGMKPWKHGSFRKYGTDIVYSQTTFKLEI